MMAQRLKALRRELHMTQTEFGRAIGLSQGHLTSIESGKRNLTDRTITTICRAFKANEQWLRQGKGEMFGVGRDDILIELAEAYHLDALEQTAVEAFLALSPKERQGALAFVNSFAERVNAEYEARREQELSENADFYAARNGGSIQQEDLRKME